MNKTKVDNVKFAMKNGFIHGNRKAVALLLTRRSQETTPNGNFTEQAVSPCGSFRQILEIEVRHNQPVKIILYGKKEIYIIDGFRDLLPLAFDKL